MAYQKVYMNQIHSSSLLCQLSQMWQRDILCDAVIQTGATSTKAHRLVLVAACPMLQSMDGAAVGNQLEVKLSHDIKQDSVTEFLRYLYDGFMMLSEDNVRDIEKISRILQVDSVAKCCADFYKVLETQLGKTGTHDAKFNFHADQAEFRHVRTSELLRSMQNGCEKRPSDTDESSVSLGGFSQPVSGRKRLKGQRSNLNTNTQQQSHGEDQFEISQLDRGPSLSSKSIQLQSLAVSVASRCDPSPSRQNVKCIDTTALTKNMTESTSHNSQVSSQNSTENNSNHKRTARSAKMVKVSRKSPSPFPSSLKDKAGKAMQFSHPSVIIESENEELDEGDGDQSILEPINKEGCVSSASSEQGQQGGWENENDQSEKGGPSHTRFEEDVPLPEPADLSLVKVEIPDYGDSTNLSKMSTAEDVGEEEGSETEMGCYGDTGATASAADGVSSTWYTQTYRETLGLMDATSGRVNDSHGQGDFPIHHHSKSDPVLSWPSCLNKTSKPLPSLPAQLPFPGFAKQSTLGFSVRQKVIRALAQLKSPVAYLRPLQRKISHLKIDELKAVCASLTADGFGQYVPKQLSSVLPRDSFLKPAPNTLSEKSPILTEALVEFDQYATNFNDISELTSEELDILCVAHPNKLYIQELCKGLVNMDSWKIKLLQKSQVMANPSGLSVHEKYEQGKMFKDLARTSRGLSETQSASGGIEDLTNFVYAATNSPTNSSPVPSKETVYESATIVKAESENL